MKLSPTTLPRISPRTRMITTSLLISSKVLLNYLIRCWKKHGWMRRYLPAESLTRQSQVLTRMLLLWEKSLWMLQILVSLQRVLAFCCHWVLQEEVLTSRLHLYDTPSTLFYHGRVLGRSWLCPSWGILCRVWSIHEAKPLVLRSFWSWSLIRCCHVPSY